MAHSRKCWKPYRGGWKCSKATTNGTPQMVTLCPSVTARPKNEAQWTTANGPRPVDASFLEHTKPKIGAGLQSCGQAAGPQGTSISPPRPARQPHSRSSYLPQLPPPVAPPPSPRNGVSNGRFRHSSFCRTSSITRLGLSLLLSGGQAPR
jgi:hypothetical protein